jgi:hypothetical protein
MGLMYRAEKSTCRNDSQEDCFSHLTGKYYNVEIAVLLQIREIPSLNVRSETSYLGRFSHSLSPSRHNAWSKLPCSITDSLFTLLSPFIFCCCAVCIGNDQTKKCKKYGFLQIWLHYCEYTNYLSVSAGVAIIRGFININPLKPSAPALTY